MNDLTGQTFNGIEILSFHGRDNRYNAEYLCRCSCGKEFVTRGTRVKSGHTKTCGCKRAKKVKTEKVKPNEEKPVDDKWKSNTRVFECSYCGNKKEFHTMADHPDDIMRAVQKEGWSADKETGRIKCEECRKKLWRR